MKKLSLVTSALLALLNFTASAQAENLLKNADVAYGEYLAGECVTCHSRDGEDRGIPNIIGLEAEGFAYIMHSYRNKELENKVMQLVAGRLDDEQIASLAVYFASLEKLSQTYILPVIYERIFICSLYNFSNICKMESSDEEK